MTRNKLLIAAGVALVLLVGLIGVLKVASYLTGGEYRAPSRVELEDQDPTPRMQGLVDEAEEAEARALALPYEEQEYRPFPVIGSRTAVWVLAQLHLLFAAFVLAVPIFALIIEFIGYKTGDKRYDKLAYEFTKLLSVSFSMTATFGANP